MMEKEAQKQKHAWCHKGTLTLGSLETSSPTVNRTSRQVLLSIGVLKDWEFLFADVATAFLHGDDQSRELGAVFPEMHATSWTSSQTPSWTSGQADAPRAWYQVAKKVGFSQHKLDGCLFILFDSEGCLCCLVGLHVDDMLISGNPQSECYCYLTAKKLLREKFNFKDWTHTNEREKLDFCGCSLVKTPYGYQLGQPEYFSKIKPITIDPKRRDTAMASQNEISALRAVLGALQRPSTQTSPQLGATVSLLSGQITAATTEDLRDANKALKFAKMNNDV